MQWDESWTCVMIGLTHFEPFYTGLYPMEMRFALPLALPDLSHIGILYDSVGGRGSLPQRTARVPVSGVGAPTRSITDSDKGVSLLRKEVL